MNSRRYRLRFSTVLGMHVPVSEAARGRLPSRGKRARRAATAMTLLATATIAHAGGLAVPAGTLPVTTLPVDSPNIAASGAATATLNQAAQTLTVNQTTQRAAIDWQSFNIGAGATVNFQNAQFGASSSTLNNIHDLNPSVIQGTLNAVGEIYLINQNGILFKDGAQVNVGSLVASALQIPTEVFNDGLLSLPTGQNAKAAFSWGGTRTEFDASLIEIEPGAALSASTGGRVMVLAPKVLNNGTVSAPEGQVIMAGAAKVFLSAPSDPSLRGFLVEVDPYQEFSASGVPVNVSDGEVTNGALGKILVDRGNATLAAFAVNQNGRMTATTSVTLNGSVYLQARDSVSQSSGISTQLMNNVTVPYGTRMGNVTFGPNSVTEVVPDVADTETTTDGQGFVPSAVDVVARNITLQKDAAIVVPGGDVRISAQAGPLFQIPGTPAVDGVRLYMDEGARIDVSGTTGVVLPVERNFINVELRGSELANSPLIRGSFLYGQKITVDTRKGTPLGDISGYVSQIGRTVAERTTAGGNITLQSEGDVILRDGSTLNVSGSPIRYTDGVAAETVLRGLDGKLYPVSAATPDRLYAGFADRAVVSVQAPGGTTVTETFTPLQSGQFQPGYVQGTNAGVVTVSSHHTVLEGTMYGTATGGTFQRTPASMPLGGSLVLGDLTGAALSANDGKLGNLEFVSRIDRLPATFGADSPLDGTWLTDTQIDPHALFETGGFTRFTANANGVATINPDADVRIAPNGSFSLTARQIQVAGDIRIPGGSVNLSTRAVNGFTNLDPSLYSLDVGAGVRIDVAGRWTNDLAQINSVMPTDPVVVGGGTIVLHSAGDASLAAGSVLEVSGGGYVSESGALSAGSAGTVDIASGRVGLASIANPQVSTISLDGDVRGYALGDGGTVRLSTSRIVVGSATTGVSAPTLLVAPEFFARGGFSSFSLNGEDSLTVADGTVISPRVQSWQVDPMQFPVVPSGTTLSGFARLVELPAYLRTPTRVTLASGSTHFGDLTIGAGARITVDPAGSIALSSGRQLTMLGVLDAPAGTISVSNAPPDTTNGEPFTSDTSVWIGSDAQLLARGTVVLEPDPLRRTFGTVHDGGSVDVSAANGYLVLEPGSVIDVSGTAGQIDLPRDAAQGRLVYQKAGVTSSGGSVTLSAREALFADGTLRAASGGGQAAGGSLTVDMLGASLNNFPDNPRLVVITDATGFVPTGARPGQSLDSNAFSPSSPTNGRAFLNANALDASGFDSMSFNARDAVEFSGAVDLTARRALAFSAPEMRATAGAHVSLQAASVVLGNQDPFLQSAGASPGAGNADLLVQADILDVVGTSRMSGFGSVTLASSGDIRLSGVPVDVSGSTDTTQYALRGGLTTSAQTVAIRAAQVYPTSLSRFGLTATASGARVTFSGNGGALPAVPLSAAGELDVSADEILQNGVLRAPFGTISLSGATSVVLGTGSTTSVSGAGALVPFGKTELSGQDYVYGMGSDFGNIVVSAPPAKRVLLDAPTLSIGGTVDVSGGGDMFAYEFVPGPGGTRDILDPSVSPNSFAVVPSIGSAYGPLDYQAWRGVTGLHVGDQIHLAGVSGLPEGNYTLLPPSYATLPGAYLVTPQGGHIDITPGQAITNADGSQLVSGYNIARNLDGTFSRGARTTGFIVENAAVLGNRAEYSITRLGDHFSGLAGGMLPGDAGILTIAASYSLAIGGRVDGSSLPGYSGAEIDIAAPRIAVVSDHAEDRPGFLNLTVNELNGLGASSLLLGGQRNVSGTSLVLTPTAGGSQVVVANGADQPLTAPDLMIVASSSISLSDNAAIVANGTPGSITQTVTLDGNGAFLRVSNAPLADVARSGFDRSDGRITVGAGARLSGTGSIVLDATQNTQLGANIALEGPGISLSAGRVSAGEVPAGTSGLVLGDALVSQLSASRALSIRSYSTIDLYGTTVIGGLAADGSPSIQSLTLDASGINGFGAGDKLVRAANVTLTNGSGAGADSGTPGNGTSPLTFQAAVASDGSGGFVTLGPGAMRLSGASAFQVSAESGVRLNGDGALFTTADLLVTTPVVTATTGATSSVSSAGVLTFDVAGTPAAASADAGLGAFVSLQGTRVALGTRFVLPSGVVDATATGPSAAEGVSIGAGGAIDVSGRMMAFTQDVSRATPGGIVRFVTTAGEVSVADGGVIDVSAGGPGSDAGTIGVRSGGTLTVQGVFRGNGVGSGKGGVFEADLDHLADADLSRLLDVAATGGFTGDQSIRVRTGNLSVASGRTVRAETIGLTADQGAITVDGTLDASGAAGGSIGLWASGDVGLGSGARLLAAASADTGRGGTIFIGTQSGSVSVASGSAFDVSGSSDKGGAQIWVRAPRDGNDVAVSELGATLTGTDKVIVEAFRTYDATSVGTAFGSALNTSNSGVAATLFDETQSYVQAAAPAVSARLGTAAELRPGIEIRSASDLTLTSDWNFFCGTSPTCANTTGVWSFSGVPGVLTLRAAGTVALNGSLNDGFRALPPALLTPSTSQVQMNNSFQPVAGGGWSYRVIGGADLGSADPTNTVSGSAGDVVLASTHLVRTSTGFIDVGAGRDVILQNGNSVIYSAGEPGPNLAGFLFPLVPQSTLPRAAIASFTKGGGDVTVAAGRDLSGSWAGQSLTDWLYRSIQQTGGVLRDNPQTAWWVRFDQFLGGIGALGGGDVTLTAGRDVSNVLAAVPTNARLGGAVTTAPDISNFVEQGGGDLAVTAGRDLLGGLYVVQKGDATVTAGRNVDWGLATRQSGASYVVVPRNGNLTPPTGSLALYPMFALGAGTVAVHAGGSATVEAVYNTTIQRQADPNASGLRGVTTAYFFTYADTSAFDLTALRGDVTLVNDTTVLKQIPGSALVSAGVDDAESKSAMVYPGTVLLAALSGDINILDTFTQYPSATGQLDLVAAGNVSIDRFITMSDVSPALLPGVISSYGSPVGASTAVLTPDFSFADSIKRRLVSPDSTPLAELHSSSILHGSDPQPIHIVARDGDITGMTTTYTGNFPKAVQLVAGRDIVDFGLTGQNTQATDITLLQAGRDIVFTTTRSSTGEVRDNLNGITWGGPGEIQINAGHDIDLGNSRGVVTIGNLNNAFLPATGASVRLSTGAPTPDYAGFVATYLDGAGTQAQQYRDELTAFMRLRSRDSSLTEVGARQAFDALPSQAKAAFVNQVFFEELLATGRNVADGGTYVRGYQAVAALYGLSQPSRDALTQENFQALTDLARSRFGGNVQALLQALPPEGAAGAASFGPQGAVAFARVYQELSSRFGGDVKLYFSQVKTQQGGDIQIMVPGGLVNAGLANPGSLTKSAANLGIVTVSGGSVQAAVLDTFQVNQSRVFTLGGGGIEMWSSFGNIDAGKGAKTVSATPPPQIVIDKNGNFVLDTTRSVQGSGIGVLLSRSGITPGDVDLIAPLGAVDAGDAGIRSAGNLTIAAAQVVNAANIQVGGVQSGVPAASGSFTGGISGLSSVDAQTSTAVAKAAEAAAERAASVVPSVVPSFITVEVIGFGEG
ncbi:MAG: filamentous hemagglutinin N-terminal domain-containing protein [Betaproteobacteria bacterium]|nr:filamentous hemagglutinin N-terminal domain-containing protein [Betaproteobacteria bacterium]